jgi:hypothetical protein
MAPLEHNVVWLMLWGTRYRGNRVGTYNVWIGVVASLIVMIDAEARILLVIAFLQGLSPVLMFNDYLKQQSQLTELRLLPLTSRDYHDAVLRYSLVFFAPLILATAFTVPWKIEYPESLIPRHVWRPGILGECLCVTGLAWAVIWSSMNRRLGTLVMVFLPVFGVLLAMAEIGFMLAGLGCFGFVFGERARFFCRNSYVEKVLPGLDSHKLALAQF